MMYRGWKSTKLHLALITMAGVCYGYVLAGHKPESFGEFCMALMAASGIYAGSHVTEKILTSTSTKPSLVAGVDGSIASRKK